MAPQTMIMAIIVHQSRAHKQLQRSLISWSLGYSDRKIWHHKPRQLRHLSVSSNNNKYLGLDTQSRRSLPARCCHLANDLTDFTGDRLTNEQTNKQTEGRPSTASVPTSYYSMWHFNFYVNSKGLTYWRADDQLFGKITNNTQHLLYSLLSRQREQHYEPRQRVHNFQLPTRSSSLLDSNYFMRIIGRCLRTLDVHHWA